MLTILAIILGFAVMLYRWYLLTVLWAWFIVPQFNLIELTLWQIGAASLFWSLFTYKHEKSNENAGEVLRKILIIACSMTLFMGIAWLIKLMM